MAKDAQMMLLMMLLLPTSIRIVMLLHYTSLSCCHRKFMTLCATVLSNFLLDNIWCLYEGHMEVRVACPPDGIASKHSMHVLQF